MKKIYSPALPEELREVLNIVIDERGGVFIKWRKGVAITLRSEGQDLMMMPLVTSDLHVSTVELEGQGF